MSSLRGLVGVLVCGVVLAACGVDADRPDDASPSGETTPGPSVPPEELDARALLLPIDAFPDGYELDPDGNRPTDAEVCDGARTSVEWIDEAGLQVEDDLGGAAGAGVAHTALVFASGDGARYVDDVLTLREGCEEEGQGDWTVEPIDDLGDEAYEAELSSDGTGDGGRLRAVLVRQTDVVWTMLAIVVGAAADPLTDELLAEAAAHVARQL